MSTRRFPGERATDEQRREWLGWLFSVPPGFTVGEVTRFGAADVTPMTIEIVPPNGDPPQVVRFEEEQAAAGHGALRRALTRDAGLRAEHVTSGKAAGDAYYLLCKLARVLGGGDPRDAAEEWISGYRLEAKRENYSLRKGDLHATLDALRSYPYSKRQINVWLNALDRGDFAEEPKPPLIVDEKGGEWTSITHLATYVRWGRDQPGVIGNKALAGLVVELGGKRWLARAWDTTTRQRQHEIRTVLVRLPDVPDPPPDDQEAFDA